MSGSLEMACSNTRGQGNGQTDTALVYEMLYHDLLGSLGSVPSLLKSHEGGGAPKEDSCFFSSTFA